MRLDRLRLPGHGLLEGSLRLRQIPLPEVEDTERQVQLPSIPQLGSRLLEASDRGIYFLGRGGGGGQEREGVEVLRLLTEHIGGLPPGLLALPPEQVNRSELEPDI